MKKAEEVRNCQRDIERNAVVCISVSAFECLHYYTIANFPSSAIYRFWPQSCKHSVPMLKLLHVSNPY